MNCIRKMKYSGNKYFTKDHEVYLRHSVEHWMKVLSAQPRLLQQHTIYLCMLQLLKDKYLAQMIVNCVVEAEKDCNEINNVWVA